MLGFPDLVPKVVLDELQLDTWEGITDDAKRISRRVAEALARSPLSCAGQTVTLRRGALRAKDPARVARGARAQVDNIPRYHRGTHAAGIPGLPVTPDPRNQRGSPGSPR